MIHVYLSLGSNLGNRSQNLSDTRFLLNSKIGSIKKCSSIYESSPWGFKSDRYFFNQVVFIETNKKPLELLKICKEIETCLGRENKEQNIYYQSRIIDIDILFFNNKIITSKQLIVPHPQMQKRLFVLIPLNEIAPDIIHPYIKKTVAQLLLECKDNGSVLKIN